MTVQGREPVPHGGTHRRGAAGGYCTQHQSWGMIKDLLTLPDTDVTGKQNEISLSWELLLRQLPPEVRTQIPEPYAIHLDDLIRTAQNLTDSMRATKRVPAPALPVSTIQQEEGAEQEVNAVARRRPAPHNRWNSPELCHYYRQFSRDTRNCLPPCSFTRSKNRGGGSQQDRPPWQQKNPVAQNQ